MDPSLYKSSQLNLYSQDGKKRLFCADSGGIGFSFDYKDDQTGAPLPITIPYQFVYFQGDNLPLTQALTELKQAVTDETAARETADTELWDEVEHNQQSLSAAINGVNQSLGSYVASLSSSISSVNQQVSYDRNDRENADFALGARIDTEIYDRQQAVAIVQQSVDSEASARVSVDNSILEALTFETNERRSAVLSVEASVASEATARTAADGVLQAQIIGLVAGGAASSVEYKQLVLDEKARAMAELAEEKARAEARELAIESKAVSDAQYTQAVKDTLDYYHDIDVKRAIAEEEKLGARIDFITHNTSPTALDSLSEIVAKFSTDGVSYSDRLTHLEGIVMALVNR